MELLARAAAPLLRLLFPGVRRPPAQGAMTMNLSANLLGLDNAAALGLTAMRELQTGSSIPARTARQAMRRSCSW